MKIAIMGSRGYIARHLINALKKKANNEIIELGNSDDASVYKLNLLQPNNFDYTLFETIDFLIFTAAISNPDICAAQHETSFKVNVVGTKIVIEHALHCGVRVLFFSSDAVFGTDNGEFNEDSPTQANTLYGIMKKEIEDSFKDNKLFRVIRLSYVASKEDKFIKYCFSCLNNNIIAEVYHPLYRNVITLSIVISVVLWLLSNWDVIPGYVLNVAGPELVSRIRLADEFNRIYGDKLQYIVNSPGVPFYDNRPAITQMKSKYLYRYGIIENKSFTEFFRSEFE